MKNHAFYIFIIIVAFTNSFTKAMDQGTLSSLGNAITRNGVTRLEGNSQVVYFKISPRGDTVIGTFDKATKIATFTFNGQPASSTYFYKLADQFGGQG